MNNTIQNKLKTGEKFYYISFMSDKNIAWDYFHSENPWMTTIENNGGTFRTEEDCLSAANGIVELFKDDNLATIREPLHYHREYQYIDLSCADGYNYERYACDDVDEYVFNIKVASFNEIEIQDKLVRIEHYLNSSNLLVL
jgi:hypothetical protein